MLERWVELKPAAGELPGKNEEKKQRDFGLK
jgi:hypothetical protein